MNCEVYKYMIVKVKTKLLVYYEMVDLKIDILYKIKK